MEIDITDQEIKERIVYSDPITITEEELKKINECRKMLKIPLATKEELEKPLVYVKLPTYKLGKK